MRFRRLPITGASIQAGAELREHYAGALVGGALVGGIGAVGCGGPLTFESDPRTVGGQGFKAWEGTGSEIVHAKLRRPLVLGTDQWLSFVVVFRKRTSAVNSNAIAGLGSDSGSSGNTLCYLRGDTVDANVLVFDVRDASGQQYITNHTTSSGYVQVSDCRWHTAVVSTSLVNIGSASLRYMYIDGVQEVVGTAIPNALSATTFQHVSALGIRRGGASVAQGDFDVALVAPLFGRLEPGNLRSLSLNPWQLFKPQKHRPVLQQAAGGTATQDYTGDGGIVFGGAATVSFRSPTYEYTGSGGITFGGSAGVNFTDVGTGGGGTIVPDGIWTWFNDERVAFRNGSYYGGNVTSAGDIIVWKYTPATANVQTYTLQAAFEVDDHDNTAVFFMADGRVVIAYCKHGSTRVHVQVSTNAEDISAWGAVNYTNGTPDTYANIYQCGAYYWLFFRPSWDYQDYVVRTTDFVTFGTPVKVIYNTLDSHYPYIKYCQNGTNRIDAFYNTAHPNQVSNPDLYHVYFTESGGALIPHKSDGTVLSLPVLTTTSSLVYDSGTSSAWIWQVRPDQSGYPCVLFARFQTTSDHRAMFSRWNGTAWTTAVEITTLGTHLYAGEVYYSGGMCFDGNSVDRVYVSKQVGSYWEIQQFDTTDSGATWAKTADITTGSTEKNCRPFSPVGHDGIKVFWWAGTYTSYTSYSTRIEAYGATAGTSVQYARPNADVSDGAWTSTATPSPTVLYTEIDETSEEDAGYISCTTIGSKCTMGLSTLTDPLTGTGHILRVRARAPYGGRVTVELNDTTVPASRDFPIRRTLTLTPLFTTYEIELTADEANQLASYAAFQISFTALSAA